jgi:hypothetical protein
MKMRSYKTFKEIYEEIEKHIRTIIEIAARDLKTRFSLTLSERALEEIDFQYQKIIEVLNEFQPQNELEERIKKYALRKKEDKLEQAIHLYGRSKELLAPRKEN